MRVKICGITNIQDALDAIEAGADALGFVFYEPSPRYIDPKSALEIIQQLPPFVQAVGLFVNEPQPKVDTICRYAKIDMAQIITEDQNYFKNLQTKYIEVIRAQSKKDIENLDPKKYYLVDAFVEGFGGQGKRIALDWFEGIDCSKIIIAGGLTAQNLKELDGYGFFAVDVSSGVEASKGKKDKNKMIQFVKEANALT